MLDTKKAIEAIRKFHNKDMLGKKIGLKDKNGREIKIGDLVDYYFAAHPLIDDPSFGTYADDDKNGHTLMEDVVLQEDDKTYFYDPDHGGGFAWRHAPHCIIVGQLDNKLLNETKS